MGLEPQPDLEQKRRKVILAASLWTAPYALVWLYTIFWVIVSAFWPSTEGKAVGYKGNHGMIVYTYTVNGKTYSSDRLGPEPFPLLRAVDGFRFSLDKPVNVYYNPRNPQDSALERNVPLNFVSIFMALYAAFGIWAFCDRLRQLRTKADSLQK